MNKKIEVQKIYELYKVEYNTFVKRPRIFRYLNNLLETYPYKNILNNSIPAEELFKWYNNMKIKRIILLVITRDNINLNIELNSKINKSIKLEDDIERIYNKFPDKNKGGTKKCLRLLLPQLKEKITSEELINILHKIKPERGITTSHCYKILCFLYNEDQKLLNYFQTEYRETFKTLTNEDIFKAKGEWYENIVTQLYNHTKNRLEYTSSYPEKLLKQTMYREISSLNKFENYIKKIHKNEILGNEPLRWFFNSCNIKMIKNILYHIGKDLEPKNEIVRSSHSTHHAKEFVCCILSTFKNPLNDFLKCKKEIHGLKTKEILDSIPNKRESNDSERRDFEPDELIDLYEIAKTSKYSERNLLFICILREVGLRIGSITNLKTRDLWEYGKPKKETKVLEKKLTYRSFPLSSTLQNHVKNFMNKYPHIKNDSESWIFQSNKNPNNHVTNNTLREWLKKLCKKAEIYGHHVHPHAFRHTIVNDLMLQGNTIDNVSRYMGHSNVSTTEQYYWTSKLSNIIPIMKIPWLQGSDRFGISSIENEVKEECETIISENNLNINLLIPLISEYHNLLTQDQLVKLKKNVPQIENIYKLMYDYAESTIAESI